LSLAIAALALGLLAIASIIWFPTVAILLGVVALASGIVSRRWSGSTRGDPDVWTERLSDAAIALGAAAIVGTLVVVILTTD
jgi:hypothetical protein